MSFTFVYMHARAACWIKRPEFLWTAAGGTPRIRSFKGGEFVIGFSNATNFPLRDYTKLV